MGVRLTQVPTALSVRSANAVPGLQMRKLKHKEVEFKATWARRRGRAGM